MSEIKNNYFSGYMDKNKLVHMEKGIPTENGILFRAYLSNFVRLNEMEAFKYKEDSRKAVKATIVSLDKKRFQANPPEEGPHFSFENMLGLYSEAKHYSPDNFKHLPVFYWNVKKIKDVAKPQRFWDLEGWARYFYYRKKDMYGYWLHPNGWAVFLSYRSKFWLFLLYWLVVGMALNSVLRRDLERTTGRCRWFLVLNDLNIKWPIRLGAWRWRKELREAAPVWPDDVWYHSFIFYVTRGYERDNWDNPIIYQANEYFKEEVEVESERQES